MRCLLRLLLMLLWSTSSYAQRPFFRELVIDRQDDDLKTNTVFQAANGLVYLGTNKGLFRFDGFDFRNISVSNNLIDHQITAIADSDHDGFYTGSEMGELMLWKADKPERIPAPFHSPVRSLFFDEDNVLWVATYGEGLFYRTGSIWHRLAGLPDPFIYTLQQHPSGLLLAGTDGGLVVINKKLNPIRFFVYTSRHGLPDNIVRSIGVLPDNHVLLGLQEKGICRFDLKSRSFIPISPGTDWKFGPVSVMVRLQNEFWMGTDGNGLVDYEFSGDRRTRHFAPGTDLPCSRINALMRDTEGNIWIAGDNKLILSPGEKVEFVSSIAGTAVDSVQAITTSPDGYIWYSTPEGLFRFDYMSNDEQRLKKFVVDPKLLQLHIVSLFEDDEEYLWIGTFDNGLYCLDPHTGIVHRFAEKDGLPNSNVISIHGRGNSVWLATLGGVVELRRKNPVKPHNDFSYAVFARENGPVYNGFVYSIYVDKKNQVWMGTDGKGLLMYDGSTLKDFPELKQKDVKVVYSIVEDLTGTIWFSTLHHGIYLYDRREFRAFNLSNGLSELEIFGLGLDNNGNILAINRKGIDIIQPNKFHIRHIGEESGLKLLDADLNSIARDRKGGVWIGTRSGIVRFFNYSKDVATQPRLEIHRVLTFMKQDVGLKDTVFDYNQNNISIEYTGLWFSQPEKVTYRYRMKGYSNDWIPTRDRIVTFPNLPPGKYTFEVMAGLDGQFRDATVASYSFYIRKAVWKETWFVMIIISLLAGVIVLYIRDRDIRFRRMESLKKEKVEYQYETLKSQVNPHFLFNSFNTLMAIIESEPVKATDYVEKLSDYFRNMVQHRDKDVVSLEEELEMVETYYFLQQKRFGEHLSLGIDIPKEWKRLYGVPPLSLQLLIENAVKHNSVSFETPLKITVTATDRQTLLIRNNLNLKLKPDVSTGIGLENIVNRFSIIAGKEVKVTSQNDEFVVEIPLITL